MNQDDEFRSAVHRALAVMVRPAPELPAQVVARVRAEGEARKGGLRRLALRVAFVGGAALVAVLAFALHQATLPPAIPPGPIARGPGASTPISMGQGASIAWLDNLTGFDPKGHVVGRIESQAALRSADGDTIYVLGPNKIEFHGATDGRLQRTITRPGSGDAAALSADDRYMAILDGAPPAVEMINLTNGNIAVAPVGSAFATSGVYFALVSRDGSRVVVVNSFWKTPVVAVLRFDGTTLTLERQASDGQPGHRLASCDGMGPYNAAAIPVRLLADGNTMVSACPGDGVVSWVDLSRLTVVATVKVPIANPFWLQPVFSADASMIYAYEPGTGRITSIDLTKRVIIRSAIVNAPTAFDPFGWLADRLFPSVDAGGLEQSGALSPDGTTLYVTGGFDRPTGVAAIDVRDFHVLSQWKVEGGGSLWLSGDGQTVYTTNGGGDHLSILHLGDGSIVTVALNPTGSDFLPLAN